MLIRRLLLGSAIAFAPENDDGGGAYEDPPADDGYDDQGDEDDYGDDDDPDLADDQDDADDGDDADEPPQHQQRQDSRGQNRIQRLNDRAKAEKERADRLQAELDAARRSTPAAPQRPPEEVAAERERRLAQMTAEERVTFLMRESEQRIQQQINETRFQTWEANDQAAFSALCGRNPAIAKVANRVEKRLQELRASGNNAARETVAKYVLGEMALERAGRAGRQGREREREGRERHQVSRPPNGRGDVSRGAQGRTNDREARRKRLEGQII